ncbi:unnamed protein product, partial [Rotaria sordida]
MNLDAVSTALAQISFTIKSLSKKNFKNSLTEIANLVSEHGFEAERHLYQTLISYLDLQSIEQNGSLIKRSENIHLNYWLQEIPSLISKPNFVTLICYAFDTAITQQSLKLPSPPSNEFLTSLCKLFKLNRAQELIFVFALQNSIHTELQLLIHEHIQQRLPEFIRIASGDNGMNETGLIDLSTEVLHSLLLFIQQYISNDSIGPLIKSEEFEKFLDVLRKEYPRERIGNNGSVILLPLLYSSHNLSIDLTSNQLLSDSNNLPTTVWQMDGSLADVILEMGYNFTACVEDCRNALIHFGLQELKPSTIARMLSVMIKTHSGHNENTHIYDSNGTDIIINNEKNSLQTWNVDTFVLAINDLVPTVNWKDVVKELDQPGFIVRDRQALVLLVTALRRALPVELYIDLLYGRWNNVEGQLSWIAQATRHPDIFCFGDHPAHPVLIDCLKHPLDDTKETWTWRSLNLIECLLRIADTGLYSTVLEIFRHGIQRSGELIFLGLLQLHTVWTTLKQELLQLIIPTFLANSPNANPLLNYMWNSQHHTTALRTTLLTSLADWYNRANDNEQQQRLSRVLEVVQDLKTLPTLLGAQPMTFILDLACLASRRGYLKLDKWLSDKLREHQELFVQTTIQYVRKKAPQLLLPPPLSKDDINFKSIINAETINVLLTVLQLALPLITNNELIQEIQTMLSTAKILNTLTSTTTTTITTTTTGNIFSNTNLNEQTLQRPNSISLSLNPQQLYHHSTSFTPSPTNPSSGLSLTAQLRSLLSSSGNDPLAIGSSSSSTTTATTTTSMGEIADVDVYFKRLYSKTNNPPPISVDEFLDIMTRCKDSQIQREKDVFNNGIRNLFEEYKFYIQYPERELHLTAQLFGGLFERGLFQQQALIAAYRAILEGLKKPTGTNLWNFAVTALDRCKARIREQPTFLQGLRSLITYSEIPLNIREYLEYGTKTNIQQQFDPLRTLTPTSNLTSSTTVSPQPQISHSTMNTSNMFPRMNSGPPITNQQQYVTGNGGVGRENPAQKGPSLTQNANIRTLMSDPSYLLVRIKPPPEQINDKIAFTFNNLSFANLSQKAEELKDVLGNDEQLWKWVAQYLVMKRASIEPNFHSLYAGFINTINVNILYDTVLTETHRNIKILLLSDKQMNNIPDRALLKNLGHWLGIITIAKNKPILATDLEIKSLVIEAYHMGSQELLYVVPFVAKILESCTRSKIFQQPNPWLMGIMSVLAEMHSSPDFKLNLKFEIEVLCRQLQIQLTDLPIHHTLSNKEYFDKIEKQLSNNNRQSSGITPLVYQSQQSTNSTSTSSSLYNDPAILNYHQLSTNQQSSTATSSSSSSSVLPIPIQQQQQQQQQTLPGTSSSSSSTLPPVPKYKLSDFKPSIFQSLSSMLEINPNILLFQHHPRLKTYIHSPIEQAINESLQTVQRSLKVATSAAETIVRKDFLLNPDEQQLRTSARNMVAYLSSGLVLITARPALQDQIQSYIKTHLQTVLGVPQVPTTNSTTTTNNNNNNNNNNDSSSSSSSTNTTTTTTTSNGTTNDQLSSQTREMIHQAATEIAASNIELCCCLLQRITIHRAIQLIDQRLASDIEIRQRCRLEGRQLPTATTVAEFQSDRLLEPIRLRYGPLSSHQLAIYEDFVHFIPGFKPSDNEKRDLVTIDETGPSVWDRLIAEIDQIISTQHNQTFANALQRLLENVNILRTNLHNQTSPNAPQVALNNVLNIIIYNLLEHYTLQSQTQDGENLERFKNVHMSVLKLLVEIRLHMSLINKQLTKAWLECPNELKFNVYAVNQLLRNRLLDIRQMDTHVAQLIDSGNNPALHFAVNFLRNCVIEQPCCVDSDIASILDSLHRISLIGKQPAEAVRDLLEIIRLNYTSLTTNNETNSTNDTNNTNTQSTVKIDKLAIISLSVISNGHKYLTSNDEIETTTIANKAKHILSDWVTLTMTQTNRISQQQSFQGVFNQMNMQGLFRSDDTIAKFLRMTIQLCVNSVYDIIRQAPPITSSSSSSSSSSTVTTQQAHYTRCHQGIDSLCRFLSLLTTHTSDINNYGARIHLINRILGILAAHCFADHEEQGDQFHPLAYQRIILNLFQESTAAVTSNMSNTTPGVDVSSANEYVMYYIYLAFTNCLHLLRPQRVPGFAFAWLEIVAHRTFMSRLLLSAGRFTRQTHNMYALLLVDALRLV